MSANPGFWRDFFVTPPPDNPPLGVVREYADLSTGLFHIIGPGGISALSSDSIANLNYANDELLSVTGSSATLAHIPNGKFLMIVKNGMTLSVSGGDYTRIGATLSFTVPADPSDVFVAWYTY